jgi:hypothetical protein
MDRVPRVLQFPCIDQWREQKVVAIYAADSTLVSQYFNACLLNERTGQGLLHGHFAVVWIWLDFSTPANHVQGTL